MTPAGGGIQEVGYTEDGIVWARLTMLIEGKGYQGMLQMAPETAAHIAEGLKTSAEKAKGFVRKT